MLRSIGEQSGYLWSKVICDAFNTKTSLIRLHVQPQCITVRETHSHTNHRKPDRGRSAEIVVEPPAIS